MLVPKDAVFLISGCSSGFGEALTKEALSRGYRVIATARKLESLVELEKLGAKTLRLDVTDSVENHKEFAKAAVAIYGQVDYLINNAGIAILGRLEEFNTEQTQKLFHTNFFGLVNLTHAMLPYFRKARHGVIVNISSELSVFHKKNLGMYCASKAAVDMYATSLSQEVAAFGIKVLTIQPGEYATSILGNFTLVDPSQKIPDYATAELPPNGDPGKITMGDPAAAAVRMLDVMTLTGSAAGRGDELPAKFPIGADAVLHVRKSHQQDLTEMEKWSDLGEGEGQAVWP